MHRSGQHSVPDATRPICRPIRRVLVFLCVFLCSVSLYGLEPDEQLQFADGLYARSLYSLAVPEYVSFLKASPKHSKADVAHYRLGECYRNLKQTDKAAESFDLVFSKYRRSEYRLRAGFKLSQLKIETGDHASAVKLLRSLLDNKPPKDLAAASLYFLGRSLLTLDKTDEAISALDGLTKKYPSSPFLSPALLVLGNIYAGKTGGAGRAVIFYRRAAKTPASERVGAEAWFQLAELYLREKSYGPSAEAYEQLFTLYPKDERVETAHLSATWALHNAGRYADALQRIADIVGERPSKSNEHAAEWLYLKANCERQLLKYKLAIKSYGRITKYYPKSRFRNAAVYENAIALHKLNQFKDAIESLKGFTPDEEQKKDVYWLMAEAYAAIKDNDNAIQYYRMLITQYPESKLAADATYRLAHLLQGRGEFAEASKWYLALVQKSPKNEVAPQSLFASAYCLSKSKEYEGAARDWSRVIAEYPNSPLVEEASYQKAMSEAFLRRDDQARATLRTLLKKFPTTRFAADARLWLGILLKEKGDDKEATKEFRAALALKPSDELRSEAWFHLGLSLQKLKEHGEAATFFEKVLSSKQRDKLTPAILEWLAEHRHEEKNFAAALSAAEFLAQSAAKPEWGQIGWCLVGRAHLALGQDDKASKAYEKSFAISAKTKYACESALRLGELGLAKKRYAKARKYFEQSAELASDDATMTIRAHAYAGLARSFMAEEKWEDAARHFMSVAILFDDAELVPECLYEASRANAKLGREEARKNALRELAARYPDSKWAKKEE